MLGFGRLLPRIRAAVRRDLQREGLVRRRVMAAIVRLLESSLARIGHDEYAEANGTYGLATLRKRHVTLAAAREAAAIEFVGKGSQDWLIEVTDPRIIAVVAECVEAPGHELFKYDAADGQRKRVSAPDVLAYLAEISGHAVRAKDFRTWSASVLAAKALGTLTAERPRAKRQSIIVRTVEQVAEELRNTAAVCRASYICPDILEAFDPAHVARAVDAVRRDVPGLRREEATVLAFLDRRFAARDPLAAALAA
jgi:DNA topoisomerase-1